MTTLENKLKHQRIYMSGGKWSRWKSLWRYEKWTLRNCLPRFRWRMRCQFWNAGNFPTKSVTNFLAYKSRRIIWGYGIAIDSYGNDLYPLWKTLLKIRKNN